MSMLHLRHCGRRNKEGCNASFTQEERDHLKLNGLIPYHVLSLEEQVQFLPPVFGIST